MVVLGMIVTFAVYRYVDERSDTVSTGGLGLDIKDDIIGLQLRFDDEDLKPLVPLGAVAV